MFYEHQRPKIYDRLVSTDLQPKVLDIREWSPNPEPAANTVRPEVKEEVFGNLSHTLSELNIRSWRCPSLSLIIL